MKKIFALALAAITLAACNNGKNDEKTVLNDVIKIHDTVMAHSELLMKNKMKLDTMLKTADDTAKAQIELLKTELSKADDDMEDWMQKFDPEQKGKTHDEVVKYLNTEKIRIHLIDSTIDASIKKSAEYLKAKTK